MYDPLHKFSPQPIWRSLKASQVMLVVKNLPANAGDVGNAGLIPGSGRSPGGGHGSPLQYSCLENPMDRGGLQATVRSVAELDTSEATAHTHGVCLIDGQAGDLGCFVFMLLHILMVSCLLHVLNTELCKKYFFLPVSSLGYTRSILGGYTESEFGICHGRLIVERCYSVPKLNLTLCDPVDCSTPCFPVLYLLPEFAQIHVHWVGDAVWPSHPLLPSPFAFLFPSIRVFCSESAIHIRWPKYWSFSNSPFKGYSVLTSFKIDWFDLLPIQETLKSSPALQFKSISSLVLSLLHGPMLLFIP